MDVKMDLHTHSVSSGHHTNDTVTVMAEIAKKRGIEYLGITDHAPKMDGAPKESYFRNLKYADKVLYGVRMLYGAELNVLNVNGDIDLPEDILSGLDYSIAGLHKKPFAPLSEEENTTALIKAMENPFVSTICHPDDPLYRIDVKKLVDGAKATKTMLELSSVGISNESYRGYGISRLVEMLLLCKQKEVFITLGSDSHGKEKIGDFKNSIKLLELINFPKELVVNFTPKLFFEIVKNKKN